MRITDFATLESVFPTQAAAARALGMSPQAFWNFKQVGRLPAHKYLAHRAILERLGHEVDETLWSFDQPADSAA